MGRLLRLLALIALSLSSSLMAKAQDATSLTGIVTDTSGAVVRHATVTLTNPATGAKYSTESNNEGVYRFNSIKPGPGYKITFAETGFTSLTVSDIYLNVATTRTQNATLGVGAASDTVEVTGSAQDVTINTDDASIGNNFDVKLLNELPVLARNTPAALFNLQPGVTAHGGSGGDLDGAVTGARVDQNNVTIDGLDVNDFATGNRFAITGNAPVDSIQEFRGTVAGFTPSSGPGGGGQFQLVTKSGTNSFHGNVNEYHRDTSTVANNWFNNNSSPQVPRAPYIQNQFGGNIGGPVLRNKLFFFFDYDNSRIIRSSSIHRTVPLDSLRNGNVSYILNKDASGNTCVASSRQNTTPQCIGSINASQIQALDPKDLGLNQPFLDTINARYPHANDLTGGDGINTGYYRFNGPIPDFATVYVGKIDYTLTSKMKFFGRFTISRENSTQAAVQFPGDPVTSPFIDRSYAYVVGHDWTISPTKVNRFFYGDTIQKYSFPVTYNPQGINPLTFGDGTTTLLSDPYTTPVNGQTRRTPIPMIGDDFTWQRGHHTLQFGGTFKFIKADSDTKLDYNTITIGLGGQTLGLNSSLRPAGIRTAGTTASNTYDSAFAFALGRIGSISSGYNYDNKGNALPQGSGDARQYRYFQTQFYFGDTWKVTPSLTLSYGVNYQIFSVPYETHGLESTEPLSFDQYFSARVKQSAAGLTGNDAVPLITYGLGGKANHAPALYSPSYKDIAPRFAFAYSPSFDRKTVFNGGAGLVYDRTVINAVQYQQDQHSYLFQQSNTTQFGIPEDPVGSLATDPRVGDTLSVQSPPAIKAPYQPFVDPDAGPYGLQNGQAFNTIIDPTLKTPYSISYNVGMQHELPAGFIMKLSYVGRLGRRLLAQADANQLIEFVDPTSGQKLSTAFGNMTQQIRAGADPTNLQAQAWFENLVAPGIGQANGYPNNTSFLADNLGGIPANGDFADFVQAISSLTPPNAGMAAQFSENTFYTNKGFSSYNGLLASLQKNLSRGLHFDLNYTWSHSIDNVSLVANTSAAGGNNHNGGGFICDVVRPRLCRGNSDFDVNQIVSGDFTYDLPFGRGKIFGSTIPFWLNEAIGGWALSGITEFHTGNAWGTVSSAFVAGYSNNAPGIFTGSSRGVLTAHPHKTSAGQFSVFADSDAAQSSYTGPVGFEIGSRDDLRGPRFFNQDLGLAKTFPIYRETNLKFRADAFNAFNHPSFDTPTGNDITDPGTFGQITATTSSARVLQLALRLEF